MGEVEGAVDVETVSVHLFYFSPKSCILDVPASRNSNIVEMINFAVASCARD